MNSNSLLSNTNSQYLNTGVIKQYDIIPIVSTIIIIVLVFLMIKAILSLFNIKNIKRDRGIINELDYINKVKKRDASIIRSNKFINKITRIVEKSPFKQDSISKEYLEYNLYRANVRIPGGSRTYKADEFNAIKVFLTTCIILLSILIGFFANFLLAIVMIFSTIIISLTTPMTVLRSMVKAKDDEIKENFLDFYIMIHYTILEHSSTPLNGLMKSYAKTTESHEMRRLIDVCVHYIDTYGEYESANYISKAYREIPVMCKLMRLIKQSHEGGNIEQELMGFRTELLNDKEYTITKRGNKLAYKAQVSFNILMPILFQAIISACYIYFDDIQLVSSFVSK